MCFLSEIWKYVYGYVRVLFLRKIFIQLEHCFEHCFDTDASKEAKFDQNLLFLWLKATKPQANYLTFDKSFQKLA